MKKYEKPMIMIMPLEGNEQLCGSCAGKTLINPAAGQNAETLNGLIAWAVNDEDGVISRQESEQLFGPNEQCQTEIEMYCKFTSTGDKLVAWS